MKNNQIILLIIVIACISTIYSCAKTIEVKSQGYKILFWDTNLKKNPDILEDIKGLTYPQFIVDKKIKIRRILPDDYILKYHWDLQLLEIDSTNWKRYLHDKGQGGQSYFFTIVLNNKIIYHGISRIAILSRYLEDEPTVKILKKYDNSDYPSITTVESKDVGVIITTWALKPKLGHFSGTLRDFDEKEQKKILYDEVLEYFEKTGKIMRGNSWASKWKMRRQ